MVWLLRSTQNIHLYTYLKKRSRSLLGASIRRQKSTQLEDNVLDVSKIRNFSIIAHVDHGKSTLADRLLELTGAIKPGAERAQVLDQLQVERERGITVKAVTASLNYTYNNEKYLLNLIDTPAELAYHA